MILLIIAVNIILANVVSAIEVVTSLIKHATINRRRQLIITIAQCFLCMVTYFLLGAYVALINNGYAIAKYIFILITHKEQKIKLGTVENILLNIPYIAIAILLFKHDGWLGIMYSVVGCLDDSKFVLKKDIVKQKWTIVIEAFYAIYEFCILDFVKSGKNIINVVINILNVIRIKKNGEDVYYKKEE